MTYRPGNRIVRNRWTVYPVDWKGLGETRSYVICHSRLQMKKAMEKMGPGATAEYDPVVRHKNGGVAFGWVCDPVTEPRYKRDCWERAVVG